MDDLVKALGPRYLWVDATYHSVRVDGRVVSQATFVAIGFTSAGERQVLGVGVGPSEDGAFWTAFLRRLVKRGFTGVRLVVSDAHEGLKQAISTVLHRVATLPRPLHAQPARDPFHRGHERAQGAGDHDRADDDYRLGGT